MACPECGRDIVGEHYGGCPSLIREVEKHLTLTKEELLKECRYFSDHYDPTLAMDAAGNVMHDPYAEHKTRMRRFLGATARYLRGQP
jgi:hypothetical protein